MEKVYNLGPENATITLHQEEEILKHTHAHGSKNIMSKAILSLPRLDDCKTRKDVQVVCL